MRTLDELWKAASGGKFGYSVQREIWVQNRKQWPKFFKAIDWVVGENNVYRWGCAHKLACWVAASVAARRRHCWPARSRLSHAGCWLAPGGPVDARRRGQVVMHPLSCKFLPSTLPRLLPPTRKWPAEFNYSLDAPKGHLPLTNALRGTRLFEAIMEHEAYNKAAPSLGGSSGSSSNGAGQPGWLNK